jgi:hypothetical protein
MAPHFPKKREAQTNIELVVSMFMSTIDNASNPRVSRKDNAPVTLADGAEEGDLPAAQSP